MEGVWSVGKQLESTNRKWPTKKNK
jgi:hypothetical protein